MTRIEQFEKSTGHIVDMAEWEINQYDQDLEFGASWEYANYLDSLIPRWIPITERVPDEPCDLIVTDGNLIFEARFINSSDGSLYAWTYLDGGRVTVNVTHWMSKDDLRRLL